MERSQRRFSVDEWTPRKHVGVHIQRGRTSSLDGSLNFSILHVEDNSFHIDLARRVAEKSNRDYVSRSSGEEALECVEKRSFDVLLMDINLSGGGGKWDGYTTAEEILKLNPSQIIYSASSDDVRNPLVNGRIMFQGHLGKTGIVKFIRKGVEEVIRGMGKKIGKDI